MARREAVRWVLAPETSESVGVCAVLSEEEISILRLSGRTEWRNAEAEPDADERLRWNISRGATAYDGLDSS